VKGGIVMDNGSSSYNRFLKGDDKGLEDLVSLFSKNLTYFIFGFVKSYAAAEDIMLDSFAEIVIYKNRYKDLSVFKTYLYRIARNKSIDYIRKNYKCVSLNAEAEATIVDKDIEETFLKTERDKQIGLAVFKLHSDYREIITLIYYNGMSVDEAAEILNVNKKCVYNLLARAKLALKSLLEKEGINENL